MTLTAPRSIRLPAASLTQFWMVLAELLLAAVIGLGLLFLGSDGTSWILGGIAAGAIVFVVSRSRFQVNATPNRNARKIGQLLVGLTVGFSVQHSDVGAIAGFVPLFVLLTGCLLVGSVGVAAIYTRLQKTDWLTAMLATTPGNIGVMASIAADYGSNPALVSLVQLVRFTAVTSAIPLLSNVSHSNDAWAILNGLTHHLIDPNMIYLARLVLVLAIASLSVKVGETFKIPVPALMCPLMVGIGFNALVNAVPFLPSVDFNPPTLLNLLGQILLGTTIGEYWGMNPNLGRFAIARATVPAGLTLLVGLGVAVMAKLLTSWDWLTCLLVTAPGGSPEMIWIALTLNQDVELVTAGHLIRLIAINALLPLIVSVASSLERSRQNKPGNQTLSRPGVPL
ncbi:MAG: AbrB family transcriptional regulator [Leptolyngbyaceae cyanobacterium bins.349]|nr:AbrB family transcriptional regulator [Leptolyngbyaceae cyanobacterium bins.349]